MPYVWNGRKANTAAVIAERKKYRAIEAYWCPTFDAMASASLQGFTVGTGLMWFNNFKPDSQGWLPAKGVGSAGGHALTVYGVEVKAEGTVGVWVRNTWGSSWGSAGDCCIPESLFTGQIGGSYGPRISRWAAQSTCPEARNRSRPLVVAYIRWRDDSYVPVGVPVWPCCDMIPVPTAWGDCRVKSLGWPWYECSSRVEHEQGPYWHRYRRGTERMARRLIFDGANQAEVDAMLVRMWAIEQVYRSDCGERWSESETWLRWAGGYPAPVPR